MSAIPTALQAGLWGIVAGGALVIGAAAGYFLRIPRRVVAGIMAFGSGVLFSALAFELMQDALYHGGLTATALGFLAGAAIYTLASWWLARRGARHRKRSGGLQPSEAEHGGSGMAIALGALLDGIPESIVIGLGLLAGGAVNMVTVAAIFLSNLPEGLSSAAGMKKAGRSARYIFGVWIGIALASGLAALAGYTLFDNASEALIAAIQALAAGAILSMLADTMIPEAFEDTHEFTGMITVLGFLAAFTLDALAG